MTSRRSVVIASVAATAAAMLAVAFAVSGTGADHALSLDPAAAQSVAASSSGTAASGASAAPEVVGSPQQASVPSAAASSSSVSSSSSQTAAAPLSYAQAQAAASTITAAPAAAPATVCSNTSLLSGPATKPKGAVKVPAGNNAGFSFRTPHATYWFASGVHTLGSSQYANIDPGNGATFIGAPGAILDGQHRQNSAFDDTSTHITISYLTIRNFGTWGGDQQEGVVNHDSGTYWTIDHSTITGNAGAGVMLGSDDVLSYDCIQGNQQYGFNAFSNGGRVYDLVLDHNEIAGNDTYNYEARYPGCGCSGGGKFWNVTNAVVTNNWVLNNRSEGLWADTNNAGFEFVGNYIQNSQGSGLMYEISYNALIEYNTFNHNAVTGGHNGFPPSAIYLSESGSDSRVHTDYGNTLLIAHNDFLNNWGGVILWENANRFCASPDNSSTGSCTMVDSAANIHTCADYNDIKNPPYKYDCRWRTQNVLVADNVFDFSPSAIGADCTVANFCGFNGVFSQYGSLAPYQGDLIPDHIAFSQNNRFTANTYVGPWCFMGWQLGTEVGWSQWREGADINADTGVYHFGQDTQSTYTSASSRSC